METTIRDSATHTSQLSNMDFQGKVGFAIGTGRCGTEFMARVVSLEPHIASVHERNPLNETFHRYCKWYQLPVDDEGFLYTKRLEISQDLQSTQYSFESSAHLSFSVQELYDSFASKFVLLVRNPAAVVKSYIYFKNLYGAPVMRGDPNLAIGYQESKAFHHFLGRIVPSGQEFLHWTEMTQVGRVAWYWNALNSHVLEQFSKIPESHWRIVKIEELNYSDYLDVAHFLGFSPSISQRNYDALVADRPNASKGGSRKIETWTPREIAEFEAQVMPMANRLGYEYHVEKLPASERMSPVSFVERLRRYLVS